MNHCVTRQFMILSLSFSIVFAHAQSSRENTKCLVADIVIAADMSSSVASVSDFIWDAVEILPTRYELDEDKVQMSLIRFNSVATEIVELTGDGEIFLREIKKTKKVIASGDTFISAAMLRAHKTLLSSSREVPKFLILISDGQSSPSIYQGQFDYMQEESLAEILRNQGITIVGVCTPPTNKADLSPLERQWTEREEDAGCSHLEKLSNHGLFFRSSPESLAIFFKELTLECP